MSVTMDHLDADWHTTITSRNGRRFTATLAEHPLFGEAIAEDLIVSIRAAGRPDPDRADELFAELIRMGRSEPLAQRAVLQGIAPGLCMMIHRMLKWVYGIELEDKATTLVSVAALRIATYPVESRGVAIPANILLDVKRDFVRERNARFLPAEPLELVPEIEWDLADPAGEDPHLNPEYVAELDLILSQAREDGILNAEASHLLLATRIDDTPIPVVAATLGLTPDTARRSRHRTERRLVQWHDRTRHADQVANADQRRRSIDTERLSAAVGIAA